MRAVKAFAEQELEICTVYVPTFGPIIIQKNLQLGKSIFRLLLFVISIN
jgi:hypothetical protein